MHNPPDSSLSPSRPSRPPENRLWNTRFIPYTPMSNLTLLPAPQSVSLSQIAESAMAHAEQLHEVPTPDQQTLLSFEADNVSNLADTIEAKLGECFECSSFKEILRRPLDVLITM
jgi:hypothetical protein